MSLSEIACEILDMLRETDRRPGARDDDCQPSKTDFGTDLQLRLPSRELKDAGYVVAPDAETVELAAIWFDVIQSGPYRGNRLNAISPRRERPATGSAHGLDVDVAKGCCPVPLLSADELL